MNSEFGCSQMESGISSRQSAHRWSGQGRYASFGADLVQWRYTLTAVSSSDPTLLRRKWNAHIVDEALRFDRLPLPDKLTHLKTRYGLDPPPVSDAILSLNSARNCLTHRHGIVSPQDLKNPTDEGLLIKIRKLQVTVKGENGERIIKGPTRLDAGEQLRVGFVDSERLFHLGERIQFTPSEYVDLCTTFLAFALELQDAIIAFQDRRRREAERDDTMS